MGLSAGHGRMPVAEGNESLNPVDDDSSLRIFKTIENEKCICSAVVAVSLGILKFGRQSLFSQCGQNPVECGMAGRWAFGDGQSDEHFRVGFIECVASHGLYKLAQKSIDRTSGPFVRSAPVGKATRHSANDSRNVKVTPEPWVGAVGVFECQPKEVGSQMRFVEVAIVHVSAHGIDCLGVKRGGLARSDSFLRFLSGMPGAVMLPI